MKKIFQKPWNYKLKGCSILFLAVVLLASCEDFAVDNPTYDTTGYVDHADVADNVYVAFGNQPNGVYYLPGVPGANSGDELDDKLQYEWGKGMRNSERGQQAMRSMGRSPEVVASQFVEALRAAGAGEFTEISAEATPAIWKLVERAFWTGYQSAKKTCDYCNRQRPFVAAGEDPWYEDDAFAINSSYISASTAGAWAASLALAEVWPPFQNAILRAGFQFGESRVISGTNYQSDVNDGYLSGSASIAVAHYTSKFLIDVEEAREEFSRVLGHGRDYDPCTGPGYPEGFNILSGPVTVNSYRYQADVERHKYAKGFRGTARGDQAVTDANADIDNIANIFQEELGIPISEAGTPAIYSLLQMVLSAGEEIAYNLKIKSFRARPYVQLAEPTPVPLYENAERNSSSYCSGHACAAWAIGLTLVEMAPYHQNQILARAWNYGFSRQIVGYHWASDIEAGRILGSALMARLNADETFRTQLSYARAEFRRKAKI